MSLDRCVQHGVSLVEVLMTVVVTTIGLLGIAALQARTYSVESESYQRSQAAILLEDMANRIRTNGSNAAAYVSASLGGGDVEACTGKAFGADRDVCEWQNLLRGAAEARDGAQIGAMLSARSCITQPNPAERVFVITVTWQGTIPSAAPGSPCQQGQYGDDRLRRALSTVVRIPTLS